MMCLFAQTNCIEMRRLMLTSRKVIIGLIILIYFGGSLIICNEGIPICDHRLKELKEYVKDWEGRCLDETRYEINSQCCKAEKEHFQKRMRMHTKMCFHEGNEMFYLGTTFDIANLASHFYFFLNQMSNNVNIAQSDCANCAYFF